MKFKSVLRYDPTLRAIRLGRLMWTRGTVGDGKGYSVKLSEIIYVLDPTLGKA